MRAAACLTVCFAIAVFPAWPQRSPAENAADRMAEGAKLMVERTPESFRRAIAVYEEALALWQQLADPSKQVEALSYMATARFQLHETAESEALLNRALDIARAAGRQGDEAFALMNLAFLHETLNAEQKALDETGRSLAIYQSLGSQPGEEQALSARARVYQKLADTPHAIETLEQLLPLTRALKDVPGEGFALLRLGQLNDTLNRKEGFEKAIEFFTQALPLFDGPSGQFNRSYTLWGLGTANDRLGRTQQALTAYSEALPLFVERKDVRSQGRLLLSLGEDEDLLGNPQKAIGDYEKALPLLKSPGDEMSLALTQMKLGISRETAGDPARAIEAWQAAIPLWHAAGDKASEATAYSKIATARFNARDWQGALEADREALKIQESAEDRADQALSLIGIAGAYMNLGDYRNTLDAALRSVSLLEGDEHEERRALALSQVGEAYSALHDSAHALKYLNDALALDRDKTATRAGVLASIGEVYRALGDQKRALALTQEALEIDLPLGIAAATNKVLNDLGLVYSAMGKMPAALDAFEKSLASARQRKDIQQQSVTLNNLAQLRQGFGDNKEAEALYLQSLELIRQTGDRYTEAITLDNFAMVYHALGDEQKAFDTLHQALAIRSELHDRNGDAITLNNLALVYSDTGNPQKALETYAQVLAIFGDLGDPPNRASALNNLGAVYRSIGANDRAAAYFNQALRMREEMDDDDGREVTLNNLAVLAQSNGDTGRALELYAQSLKLAEKLGNRTGQASLLSGMGVANSQRGDQEQALAQLTQSLAIFREIGNADGQALAIHNLGTVYETMGDYPRALDRLREALLLWRQIGRTEGESLALLAMAKVERRQGDLDAERRQGNLAAALGHVEDSIRVSEARRSGLSSEDLRASLLSTAGSAYELKIAILMALDAQHKGRDYNALAFETSERARARSLLDLLAESRADIRQGVDPQLLAEERSIESSLNAKALQRRKLAASDEDQTERERLDREIASQTAQYEELEGRIRVQSPAYAALKQPRPLTLRQIQRQLEPDTLLLEYSLGAERSYLWAVTRRSLASFELPKREEIESAAKEFHRYLPEVSNPESFEDAAARLSAMLLNPVASQLGKKRLIVVADGALQAWVPFSALPSPSGLAGQAPPLIADHEILHEPSASALAFLRLETARRKLPAQTVAVLADPVFARDDNRFRTPAHDPVPAIAPPAADEVLRSAVGQDRLDRLAHTRDEARSILALATPAQSFSKFDFEASKTAAEDPALAHYRIVHFATHGLLDSEHPELSGLVFSLYDASGQPVDGYLRMNEVFNLRLPVQLVVLSACESGQGKLVSGEGLVGLTRGFMYAGAASLAVSLWKVNDAATAELMSRFYREMLGPDRLRPAAALRTAQLSMIREAKWKHPWYWAPFIVEGEWR